MKRRTSSDRSVSQSERGRADWRSQASGVLLVIAACHCQGLRDWRLFIDISFATPLYRAGGVDVGIGTVYACCLMRARIERYYLWHVSLSLARMDCSTGP
jgi:hypothetical protein